MPYREIIAVCSEIHTNTHQYTVWAERRIFKQLFTWENPYIFQYHYFRVLRCVYVSRRVNITCVTPVVEKLPNIQGDRIETKYISGR